MVQQPPSLILFFVRPVGTFDFSPAIYRWVEMVQQPPSLILFFVRPVGTFEIFKQQRGISWLIPLLAVFFIVHSAPKADAN
jgi:hypothetical protein